MNKEKGWILVYRSIQDHWLWEEKPFGKGQAWIDLLLLANHEPHKVRIGDNFVTCGRGQVNRSYRWLANAWGWSIEKVRRFIKLLEKDGMVTVKRDSFVTVITIENYNAHQFDPTVSETVSRRLQDSTETVPRQYREHTKNVKNEKNEKNIERGTKRTTIPPTLEEVRSYCEERGNRVDPERFMDYYSSNGWMVGRNKMKDWKAAVRNWEKKENDYGRLQNKDTDRSGVSGEVARSGNPIYRVKSKVLT